MDTNGTFKLFCVDIIWSQYGEAISPSLAHTWAFLDPEEFFNWHMELGNNAMTGICYPHSGHAFYPSKLGPVAPGPGREFTPAIFELCRRRGVPFFGYFSVGTDLIVTNCREHWVVPGSRFQPPPLDKLHFGFLAPESPWTDLLCDRIEEFLSSYPADWLLLDWVSYGSTLHNYPVRPAWFVKKPFQDIIGRPMPDDGSQITKEEGLQYKREILARQFTRILDTIRRTSPNTKTVINVPYIRAAEPEYVDHPLMTESDMLFSETTQDEIVNWLLQVKKPGQRVMVSIAGRPEEPGLCVEDDWGKWHARGCDFYGYYPSTPPDWRSPAKRFQHGLDTIRKAFQAIG
jgi:hypothetical protein